MRRIAALVAVFVFVLDQASKWAMLDVVKIAERPPIEITPFFNLVMVWNRGVSFGLFAGHDQRWLLIALSLVIVGWLIGWLVKSPPPAVAIALGAIIGGALGNVADRLRFGAVADFFDFHLAGYHWPAFNIADSAIVIGVAVLCLQSMVKPSSNQP